MGGTSRNKGDTKKAGLGHDLSITESLCEETRTAALTLKVKKKMRKEDSPSNNSQKKKQMRDFRHSEKSQCYWASQIATTRSHS